MQSLTEEKVHQLAMSPLYILYLVVSEYVSFEQISDRHIVRAIEYGLEDKGPFSEGVFELLRSHLHEFYAEFLSREKTMVQEHLRAELRMVGQLLNQLSGPPEMIEDFKTALKNFARFVADGGAFRKNIGHSAMQVQVVWLETLLA